MAETRSSQVRLSDDRTSLREPIPAEASTAPERLEDDLTVISGRGPLPDRGDGALLKPLEVGKMLEGERLGQFVLQRYVGGGGMGVVFKALDTTLNREVAVKVLAHSQSHDEETLKRFQNEAQSAARLDHENIARVYYVGVDRGVHYIVFEFIEGINLRDLVQRDGPLPLADAISFTLQVAEALAHASQRDVIHRDIKPSNVLVTPEGKAKLVDMGLARLHQVEHPDNDLTASGVTLGTFDYISPEQARDPRSADVRSDIYSLGCSFYFMLTGRPPFPEGTVLQKLLQHQAEDPVDPRQFRSDLPKAIGAILAKMLAKSPARRYQTPMELIEDLSAVVTEGSTPRAVLELSYARPLRPARESTWRRHLPWLVPLSVLALFLVAHEYLYRTPPEMTPVRPNSRSATQPRRAQPLRALPAPGGSDVQSPAETDGAAPPLDGTRTAGPVSGTWPADQWNWMQNNFRRLPDWLVKIVGGKAGPQGVEPPLDAAGHPPGSSVAVQVDGSATNPLLAPSLALPSSALPASAVPFSAAPGSTVLPPSPVASEKGVLVVAPDRKGEGIFANLQGAIAAAKSGDVIELDFSGRLEQVPLVVANTHLILRAAKGRRPVLVFRPADAGAVGYSRSMVVVAGGSLSISGLEIELEVPRRVSGDAWALVEIRRAERLRFERTTLTIRNAGALSRANHAAVAFFDLRTPLGSDTMGLAATAMSAPQIELVDCILRGEATCLRDADFEPAQLELDQRPVGCQRISARRRGGARPHPRVEHRAASI